MESMFQDMTPLERKELLTSSCDSIRAEESYTKRLTEDELAEARKEKLNSDIKIAEKEEKFKAIADTHKAELKPMKETNARLLMEIRDRARRVTGNLYMYRDEDSRQVALYDEDGLLVSARRMTPEEQQGNIHSSLRVG